MEHANHASPGAQNSPRQQMLACEGLEPRTTDCCGCRRWRGSLDKWANLKAFELRSKDVWMLS